jgi:hypothetical protein
VVPERHCSMDLTRTPSTKSRCQPVSVATKRQPLMVYKDRVNRKWLRLIATFQSRSTATRKMDANLFRQIAEVRIAAGDTAGSLPLFAFVAADPGSSRAFADSVLTRIGRSTQRERWPVLIENGSREMRKRVMKEAASNAYDSRARLLTSTGRAVALADLARGKVVVIAFWSRYCGPSRRRGANPFRSHKSG